MYVLLREVEKGTGGESATCTDLSCALHEEALCRETRERGRTMVTS